MGGMSKYSNVDFMFFWNIICLETCWPQTKIKQQTPQRQKSFNRFKHNMGLRITVYRGRWGGRGGKRPFRVSSFPPASRPEGHRPSSCLISWKPEVELRPGTRVSGADQLISWKPREFESAQYMTSRLSSS